jgi:hypothetical protein
MPAEFAAHGEQRTGEFRRPAAVPDVPLARRDDLQRCLAVLIELDRVPDRLRLAAQRACRVQHASDLLPGRFRVQAGDRLVGPLPVRRGNPGWRRCQQSAVLVDHWPGFQPEVTPPDHVGHVAERADHDQSGSLVPVSKAVRQDRHLGVEKRRGCYAAE